MEPRIGIPEIEKNASSEDRIEVICDLTRRIGLLEDLMKAAREIRLAQEIITQVCECWLRQP